MKAVISSKKKSVCQLSEKQCLGEPWIRGGRGCVVRPLLLGSLESGSVGGKRKQVGRGNCRDATSAIKALQNTRNNTLGNTKAPLPEHGLMSEESTNYLIR
jgi:hypothetical protein